MVNTEYHKLLEEFTGELRGHRTQHGKFNGCALLRDLYSAGQDIRWLIDEGTPKDIALQLVEDIVSHQTALLKDVTCKHRCTPHKMKHSLIKGAGWLS